MCTNTAISTPQADVTAFQDECARDLAVAEPVIREAEAALNSLDKASLGELKSFGSPAADVVLVVSCCIVLTAPGGKIPKARVSLCSCVKHAGCCEAVYSTKVRKCAAYAVMDWKEVLTRMSG